MYEELSVAERPIPKRLLKLKIRLDHFRDFPKDDILKAHEEFLSLPVPASILQQMVVEHLYMFDVPMNDRKQVGAKFKIVTNDPAMLGRRQRR